MPEFVYTENKKSQIFLNDFGIEIPIIGLPGFGWGTPELTAAVSNAGGLGVLNVGFMNEDEIEESVAAVRKLTDRPFAAMLFPPKKTLLDSRKLKLLNMALSPLREDFGLETSAETLQLPDFDRQFKKIIDLRVPAVGLRLGGLREPYMEKLERCCMPVFGLASNLRDAKVLVSSGVKAVVAVSWAEGGLLSYEEVPAYGAEVDSLALWPECARALKVPVIAAGSVMTEAHAEAAKLFGCAGLMLTDALLCADESPLPEAWRTKLCYTTDASTEMSSVYLGRPSRFLANGLSRTIQENELPVLDFPFQYFALRDIFDSALKQNRIDLAYLEIGQNAFRAQSLPVQSIVEAFTDYWTR